MKKTFSLIMTIAFLSAVGITLHAQVIRTPRPSPTSTVTQSVGLTDITITYSRPGVKDRVIMGDLVPYGKIWRTGANMATKIDFSDSVSVEGHPLKAGTYALFTIPGKDEWTIIFNSNYNQDGAFNYKESEDVLRFNVKPRHLSEKVETFRIDINNIRNSTATIDLAWENTLVSFKVDVGTDAKVMAEIKRAMTPSAEAGKYTTAANYYYSQGLDMNQALEWVNKAVQITPDNYRSLYLKSNIQGKMGNYKDALATAQQSLNLATKDNNDEYINFNKKNIAEWQPKIQK